MTYRYTFKHSYEPSAVENICVTCIQALFYKLHAVVGSVCGAGFQWLRDSHVIPAVIDEDGRLAGQRVIGVHDEAGDMAQAVNPTRVQMEAL